MGRLPGEKCARLRPRDADKDVARWRAAPLPARACSGESSTEERWYSATASD